MTSAIHVAENGRLATRPGPPRVLALLHIMLFTNIFARKSKLVALIAKCMLEAHVPGWVIGGRWRHLSQRHTPKACVDFAEMLWSWKLSPAKLRVETDMHECVNSMRTLPTRTC